MNKSLKVFSSFVIGGIMFSSQVFNSLAFKDPSNQDNLDNAASVEVADSIGDDNPEFSNVVFENKISENVLTVNKRTVSVAVKKHTCHAKNDKPSISKKKNRNHMDEDCCADYDEWANPGCAYSAKEMALMLSGPTPGHKKR